FTSLDEYGSGSGVGGAGVGGDAGPAGGGGAGGASAGCQVLDACSIAGGKSCSGDPQVCETSGANDKNNCGDCKASCHGGECIGGACQPLVLAAQRDRPAGVAVDALHVFWLDQSSGAGGKVLSVALSGGPISELAIQLQSPLNLVLDAQTVFFTFFAGGG